MTPENLANALRTIGDYSNCCSVDLSDLNTAHVANGAKASGG
jgi:hypothetical protein